MAEPASGGGRWRRPEEGPAGPETETGPHRGPVSFGFTRTLGKLRAKEAAEEEEAVSGVEAGEIVSVKPRETPRELIVPLIQKNRWHRPEHGTKATEEKPGGEQEDPEMLSRAVQELIEESQRYQEKWKEGSPDLGNLNIPLLLQNQAPGGFEDGERVNVELRPESSTVEDYESVPVAAYGLAMLRGMGWKEGEGIGRTFKQDVKPLEQQLRPKGLGLGADRSLARDLEHARPRRPPKPGEERPEEEPRGLAPGSLVLIQQGPHKDLCGKVEGLDPDNARAVVRLALGAEAVTVSQYGLRTVSAKEYERLSKDLSRLSAAHRESRQHKAAQSVAPSHRRSRERDGEQRDKKRKREAGAEREGRGRESSSRASPRHACWLRNDLLVRLVDRHYMGGAHYNTKVTIEDVLSSDTCVCRTEEGRLLDGIRQAMLETVIPKGETNQVMVVLGEHRGSVGRVLGRDGARCQALVQLERDEERVLRLDYDSVCQYRGGCGGD